MNPAEVRAKLRKASTELREAAEAVDHEFWENMLEHWDEARKIVDELCPAMEHARERQKKIEGPSV